MRKYLLLLTLSAVLVAVAFKPVRRAYSYAFGQMAADRQRLRNGDLIFQTSKSEQSLAIQLATHSSYSHCGLVCQQNGEWMVLEAIQPVKFTSLRKWVIRGKGDHYVVKRLRDADKALTPQAWQRMLAAGQAMLGRDYDLAFGWSNDRIYCSELIWKVYEQGLGRQVGQLRHLRDFDLSNPVVKAKLTERYGRNLPLNETVISPVSIFNSPELVTVLSR
ncbi:YiiX family permuted papain-like enzyme [Hymenobacter sp. BT662]|uniref:YiiX family permuted papain-like enzyme n=1 Tax=Hymenobacter ruricola TaxID=2791023 RepID=A0ABS0I9Y4_9BACT|nr:YiiX family permuted papain-like enzyme [Hymenobacter ruricola]